MLRKIAFALTATFFACSSFADESQIGRCTIVNPRDQNVVIGFYRPTETGVQELLVAVHAKTQIDGIPINVSDDDQFVVAYKAADDGNEIKRAKPIKIYDYKRIQYISKKKDAETPDVLIEYHGFNEDFPRRREGTRSLYIPDDEGEAKRVILESNRESTFVDAPLAKSEYKKKD